MDVLLNFAGGLIDDALASAPRLGVWALQMGRSRAVPDVPVGIAEVYHQELTVAAELSQHAGTGPGVVLKRGTLRTVRHSPGRTAASLYEECAHWPADYCRQLLAGEAVSTPLEALPAPVAFLAPANGAALAFLFRLAKHSLWDLYATFLLADQWNIGVVNRPVQDFLHPEKLQGAQVDAPALPDRHVFYADCFARQENAGTVIYFERYDFRVRRGNISRLAYPWQPGIAPVEVIGFPYHLSYPFLHGPYCMPEAWATNGIRLYDLRQLITDPAAGKLLLAVPGVDATLLEHEGRFWLFYARMDRDPMLNLFIAYADALDGTWHEHPQNPVKTDIRSARPAGPFFEDGGKLYRPAQDCAVDYGYGITINEVLRLTTTEYVEREVSALTSPHPDYPDGMHTMAAVDATHTVIDFKRRRFIPIATLMALWRPVSGLIYGKQGRRKPPVIAPAPAAGA